MAAETRSNRLAALLRRPMVRRIAWAVGALISVLAAIVVVIRVLAMTEPGRGFVERRIEAAAPAGQTIAIDGLDGDLLGGFELARVTVSDAEGVWLTAESVKADWRPWSLTGGALRVASLSADRIAVDRRPVIPEAPASEGGGGSPIRAGALDELVLDRIELAEGVAGREAVFSLEGRGAFEGATGLLDLALTPEAGEGDRLDVELDWGRRSPLAGRAVLSGPAGGLFASLAGLADDQRIDAVLTGDGDFDRWAAVADVRIDGEQIIDGEADRERDEATLRLDLSLAGHPVLADLKDRLGGEVAVTARLDLENPAAAPLQLEAVAEAVTVSFDGPLDLEDLGLAADASVKIESGAPMRLSGFDGGSVERVVLEGQLSPQDRGGVIFVGDLALRNARFEAWRAAAGGGDFAIIYDQDDVRVDLELESERVRGPAGLAADIAGDHPSVDVAIRYPLDGGALRINESRVSGAGGSATAQGRVDLETGLAELEGEVRLRGRIVELGEASRLRGRWRVDQASSQETLFGFDGALSRYEQPEALRPWLGETVELTLAGALRGGDTLVERAEATSGALRFNAAGRIAANGDLALTAGLDAGPGPVGPLAVSSTTATATLRGPVDDLTIAAMVAAPSVEAGGERYRAVDLRADIGLRDGDVSGTGRLSADHPTAPILASAGFGLSSKSRWRIDDLAANWGPLTLKGAATGGREGLGDLVAELLVSGSAPLGLPFGDIDGTAQLTGEIVEIDGTVTDLVLGALRADRARFGARGPIEAVEITGRLEGRATLNGLEREALVDVNGEVSGLGGETVEARLTATSNVGRFGFETKDPLALVSGPDGLELAGEVAGFGGALQMDARLSSDAARLTASLSDMSAAEVLEFIGSQPLDGVVSGEAAFAGEGDIFEGTASVSLSGLVVPEGEAPPLDALIEADLTGDVLTVDIETLGDDLRIAASARTAVAASAAPLSIAFNPDAAVKVQASADGEIGTLAALALPEDIRANGRIDADLDGEWPLERGGLTGAASLAGGAFEHGGLGLRLEEIETALRFDGQVVEVVSASAAGAYGGELTASGGLRLDGSGLGEVAITGDRLAAVKRREARATVSGDLAFSSRREGVALIGDLVIDRADIDLNALPSGGGRPTVDVRFPSEDEPPPPPADEAMSSLDVRIRAPGRIFAEGQGLDAELSIDARVTGSFADPAISGEAGIVRGSYSLATQRFEFDDSEIRFDGDPSQAALDIRAERTNADITAFVEISGTPERPRIELSSSPSLPEDEILSRLLFGRSPAQLSPIEAARLGVAVASLAAGGGGFNPIGSLENITGIDRIDVAQTASGATSISTGKYIAPNVYVEVRNTTDGDPAVGLEWTPFNNVEVGAEVGSNNDQRFTVQWTRDY